MTQTRILPDGSGLKRTFPGLSKGSVAELAEQCEFGIDLHSGANDRLNPPQISAALDDPAIRQMAEAFGASLMMLAPSSPRAASVKRGKRVLLFEGACRFDTIMTLKRAAKQESFQIFIY